ncbi:MULTISPECIES: class I SAM-dependent methyltransferase [Salimicrobium]|uniref:Methyltransferase n=3 Tax=Salimicrobium TaxID=351195 RepID=K2G7Q3_9BACI|nr:MULTISPECIES: class I SAM-dependent methyltransferase [Salimicrobium]AKG05391.1 SAM-dependent methyltransferase [Salimicrobium jeotgali]EKE31148.1 methyltransferase [Salimicrobium jeotgali]MBM7697311.1 2-polyprenyl-3-methyl-5-hydroxy-6-metoxy-1,4-benzoquinol methylase [Salimicrobium jeotgali]SDY22190.1 Methyltransferase domain-containing protein [Salimicrobium album]SIS84660.1 Methyltransferase domain-containing protein [Salimicrobium salexigens]
MLKDTGERVIPEFTKPENNMLLEHMARYQFALRYMYGRVLDLSCGAGYGTHMIAKGRKRKVREVIGVDINEEIIRYARGRYYHPNSSFHVYNATGETLPDELGTFDCIVSFETLEHIAEEEKLLRNYYRLLKPGGTLLVSTPFGQGRGKPTRSPFHVHQLTSEEFRDLFTAYERTSFYYQEGVLIEPPRENVTYPLGIAVAFKPHSSKAT